MEWETRVIESLRDMQLCYSLIRRDDVHQRDRPFHLNINTNFSPFRGFCSSLSFQFSAVFANWQQEPKTLPRCYTIVASCSFKWR